MNFFKRCPLFLLGRCPSHWSSDRWADCLHGKYHAEKVFEVPTRYRQRVSGSVIFVFYTAHPKEAFVDRAIGGRNEWFSGVICHLKNVRCNYWVLFLARNRLPDIQCFVGECLYALSKMVFPIKEFLRILLFVLKTLPVSLRWGTHLFKTTFWNAFTCALPADGVFYANYFLPRHRGQSWHMRLVLRILNTKRGVQKYFVESWQAEFGFLLIKLFFWKIDGNKCSACVRWRRVFRILIRGNLVLAKEKISNNSKIKRFASALRFFYQSQWFAFTFIRIIACGNARCRRGGASFVSSLRAPHM